MQYLEVVKWRDYQHYKDRDPPWIKLHFSILSSSTWVTLDDASRLLAIACMLIASRNHGRVPNDPDYLKRVAYLSSTPDFKPLIDCGFLVFASESKQVLADACTSVSVSVSSFNKEKKKIEFDGVKFLNTDSYISVWNAAYPLLDIDAELSKAAAWYVSNPKKQKKDHARFLNGWLSRAKVEMPKPRLVGVI